MKVKLIASTSNMLDIIYLSANTCYSSHSPIERFNKLDSVSNDKKLKLIDNCIRSGHTSVLEHSQIIIAVEGVSRALLAQITRHRFCSFSVKSQRYVEIKEDVKYLDDLYNNYDPKNYKNSELSIILNKYFVDGDKKENVHGFYFALSEYLEAIQNGKKPEDARIFLPNATRTDFVISCSLREFMHLCSLRLCSHSQLEIRQLMNEMVKQVVEVEPWLKQYLGPKCEQLGYCNELHNPCGRKPTLEQLLNKESEV